MKPLKPTLLLRQGLFAIATLLCVSLAHPQETLSDTAKRLASRFSADQKTLEYHVMVNVPRSAGNDPHKAFSALRETLAPIVQLDQLSRPKAVAYLDSPDRSLGKDNLVLRIRPGQLTIKVRAPSLNKLIDLKPCHSRGNKYERDYFEEPGYSISAEHRFKKDEWLPDPTKATVGDVMAFMAKHCTELSKQLTPYLKPIEHLTAPGTAQMYDARATLTDQPSAPLQGTDFSLWTFPGSTSMLAEISWKGDAKDKEVLEKHHTRIRARLSATGLLAQDQSPKTEQYFTAYFGKK